MTSWWLAWRYVAILALLLAASVAANVRQWSDSRSAEREQAAELKAAAAQAGLKVAAAIAAQKQKDDPALIEAVNRIDARTRRLETQKRPPVLPPQCAPGKARMDAVNAGADK